MRLQKFLFLRTHLERNHRKYWAYSPPRMEYRFLYIQVQDDLVSVYSKVTSPINLAMREISVPMPTIFRTSEEIQRSMSTNRLGVSFGTSRIKSSPFKELDARWVWIAKNVMAGWSRDTILPNTTQKEVSH